MPALAHQPVSLGASDEKLAGSQLLVDGTISWAVYADLTRAGQTRHIRFALKKGERLKAEYLILDRKPENSLRDDQLPTVSIKSPSGKIIRLAINERTDFYEPFSGTNYLFLSRLDRAGESGIYSVTIRAKRASSVVVAIGSREIRGEVLSVGKSAGTCPRRLAEGVEIPMALARQLIGMSERAAEVCALANAWGLRVAKRDGEDFPLTMDYRFDRINVTVESGKIIDISVG